MRKKRNSYLPNILSYTAVTILSNVISGYISMVLINMLLQPLVGRIPYVVVEILVVVLLITATLIIPIAAIFIFFRSKVTQLYYPSENEKVWKKECLLMIAPGEFCRFFACLMTLGHIKSTGFCALLPTFLFETTYVRWFDRHTDTRDLLQFIPGDYLAYAICYMLYAIVFLFFVIIVYRHFWSEGKLDYEDHVVYD